MDCDTAGDPMSGHRWTHETARSISECLYQRLALKVSASVVRRIMNALGYTLKSNQKCLSSSTTPERNEQFEIIKFLRDEFITAGEPSVSVDTKKKELIGLFINSGRTWCHEAKKVKDHDFRSEARGLASPYGIYDLQRNFGMLVVGQSADTPEFAVSSIATWWQIHGRKHYPEAKRLLILADSTTGRTGHVSGDSAGQ
ncbi:ISAzo13 family transposase, partial [bacterium]|nr:ISAzo13 family transposase [bacterium]